MPHHAKNTCYIEAPNSTMATIDFVIPLYNEQASLIRFHEMLDDVSLPDLCERRYIFRFVYTAGDTEVYENLKAMPTKSFLLVGGQSIDSFDQC